MKVTYATVNRSGSARNDGDYMASVKISSDGKEQTGIGYADEPNEAMHKAISEACGKHTQPLHDSVKLAIEVKF
jgi:hypothetical protein